MKNIDNLIYILFLILIEFVLVVKKYNSINFKKINK